jgi:predicted metal-dependent hydrolase
MQQMGLFDVQLGSLSDPPSIRQPKSPSTPSSSGSPPSDPASTFDFVRDVRARRYVIRVRRDGSVRVTIPRGGSKREARAFAERERDWIAVEQQRAALEAERARRESLSDLNRELLALARRELPKRLYELAAAHDLQVRRVSVRNQQWRWGSCSPNGHICLNWRLVQMPPSVRDYVILHELMHLKRLDHSPAFWKLVAKVCPHYQDARRWLREQGRL